MRVNCDIGDLCRCSLENHGIKEREECRKVGDEKSRAEKGDHVLDGRKIRKKTSRRSRIAIDTSGTFSEGIMAKMMGITLSMNDCVLSEKVYTCVHSTLLT